MALLAFLFAALTGVVVDGATGEPVPYVRLAVPAHAAGTIADAGGRFTLAHPDDDAVVVLSAPGYATRRIAFEALASLDAIRLWPRGEVLEERVTVSAEGGGAVRRLGLDARPRGFRVGFASGGIGSEVGAGIPVRGTVAVKGAHFVVSRTGGDRFRYRVNLYRLDGDTIGESLLDRSVLVDAPQRVGTIDVDLSDASVFATDDVVLALEWVDDASGSDVPPLMFRGKETRRSNLFLRPRAGMPFERVTLHEVTPAFFLTVVPVPGHSPPPAAPPGPVRADVVSARAVASERGTVFEVGVASPDAGCDRYADWWEVLDAEGRLVVRRVLNHSHVDEQPFERSSIPVEVEPDAPLWIRAHMHPTGYGGLAMRGTVRDGFEPAALPASFAAALAEAPPLPSDCRF